MAKNLIILDIDGTVTESENHHLVAYEYALRKMGITEIGTNWNTYEHITDRHIFGVNYQKEFQEPISMVEVKACEQLIMERLAEEPIIAEKAGAAQFVEGIWNHDGWDIAFATGSFYLPAIKKLRDAGIKHKASIVISSNEIDSREGLISAAIDAAKQLNHTTHYQSILSCGDGLWDWKTAQNSGVSFLGVGVHHKDELIGAGVKHHIDDWTCTSIDQLENYLEKIQV